MSGLPHSAPPGLGYLKSSLLLFAIVLGILAIWRFTLGTVSLNRITDRKAESFYWTAIPFLFEHTWHPHSATASLTPQVLDMKVVHWCLPAPWCSSPPLIVDQHLADGVVLVAFILTRPLGATLGDLLTKPITDGGSTLGRITSSLIIATFIIVAILFTSRKAGSHPGAHEETP